MEWVYVLQDNRFNYIFCYTDAALPLDSYVTIDNVTTKMSKVYTSVDGWNPTVGQPTQGAIGFNFDQQLSFSFGNTFYIVNSSFSLPVSGYYTASGLQNGIFGYGIYVTVGGTEIYLSMSNIVSNTGVVATDGSGVGTGRGTLAAASYGTDKAIFGFGYSNYGSTRYNITNLVSNTGVVANNSGGVGTARSGLAATGYGNDKAIFAFGYDLYYTNISNLISNTGVLATDTAGVGTARDGLAATPYGGDKGIFGYGSPAFSTTNNTNLVSNTGVIATDTTGVGTARNDLCACTYGGDKAIFGYGRVINTPVTITNLVSNTGVVATDVTSVGTARFGLAAAGYGGDKGIFGFGYLNTNFSSQSAYTNLTNLISNTGVVATDTAGVGSQRGYLAAASYSLS